MAAEEVHQYDIGTVFRVTVKDGTTVFPLDGATVLRLKFYKPSMAVVSKTATFPPGGDGTDGKMQYATLANDLDEVGTWRLQGYIEKSSWKGHTDIWEFAVHANVS